MHIPAWITETEIAVIGGGIAGTATTYFLAQSGRHVALLERHALAGEASGANSGEVGGMGESRTFHLNNRLQMGSLHIFQRFATELDWDIGFQQPGRSIIIQHEAQLAPMSRLVTHWQEQGYEVELLLGGAALRQEPHLNPRVVGLVFTPHQGYADPIRTTLGFALRARELGAKVYPCTPVHSLTPHPDQGYRLSTSRGELHAQQVVLATGAWTPFLARKLGLDIPISPMRGMIWVSEPLPPLLHSSISAAESLLARLDPETLRVHESSEYPTSRNGHELYRHLYGHQAPTGNIHFGGTRELAGYDKRVTIRGLRSVMRHAAEIFPFLRHVNIIRAWAGLMPFTPDGQLILGPVEGYPNLYLATGLGGGGFGKGPMVGKVIAELILHGKPPLPIDEALLSRFSA
ncbi:MAG: FAD-binding oxidoreductase [Nitrospinota bacterium]|nr:MAG: FAD-binding oxidoreductase [Nitrospinota bacterium]